VLAVACTANWKKWSVRLCDCLASTLTDARL
jgi:hypothetical protein